MAGEEHGEDADELDDERDRLDEEREDTAEAVTIEITGLSLYTHHGVTDAEREVGQRLVVDLRLDVGRTDATVTDSIDDTIDYAEVCQLLADYELEGVWVKATKPEPPIALTVDEVSVEVWREAEA